MPLNSIFPGRFRHPHFGEIRNSFPLDASTTRSQCDEVAFWALTCNSFTTCCTFGTADATFSTCARLALELTSPVNVTTPFFTSYLTLLLSLCWMRAASRFFSIPLSRSELTVLASLSAPGGITPTWFDTTCPPAMDLAMDSACDLSPSDGTCPPRVTTPLSRSWLTETSLRPA